MPRRSRKNRRRFPWIHLPAWFKGVWVLLALLLTLALAFFLIRATILPHEPLPWLIVGALVFLLLVVGSGSLTRFAWATPSLEFSQYLAKNLPTLRFLRKGLGMGLIRFGLLFTLCFGLLGFGLCLAAVIQTLK